MWSSQHQIIVELYLLCTGGYYARLICSVTPEVQGSHPGVCRVSSWDVILPFFWEVAVVGLSMDDLSRNSLTCGRT